MKIGLVKANFPGERRVPLFPKDIKDFKNEILVKEKVAISDNKQQIRTWSEQTDEYTPFKEIVNQELAQLGLEFKLQLLDSGQGYKIEHLNTEIEMTVDDLSEGERRLLAFIHFYYDLFENFTKSSGKFDSLKQIRNFLNLLTIVT
ncbi:AAA family ATPase [Lactococcus lactis]|nr:AAA family ATPase [Lactococcus lactis]